MRITVDSHPIEKQGIPEKLRQLARAFVTTEQQVDDFDTADALHRGSANLRFVAQMVEEGSADDDTGLLWCAAAYRLLAAVRARMDDAVHEERAQRRVELPMPKPSDTPAAKRAYAKARESVEL
jgi:hypothetical protein